MFDTIIKNGQIVDGTGKAAYPGDLGLKDGKIKIIGEIENEAHMIIDATGLSVSPGFIDIHSHSDIFLMVNPMAESKIRQGVTTEVVGNCGNSAAPLSKENLSLIQARNNIITPDLEWNWLSMGDYLTRFHEQGSSVNIVPLIGHGTVRASVMGYENRKPSSEEMAAMKAMIHQAMEDGAAGMSSGLIYAPSYFAKTDELIELAGVVAKHGGVYTSHIRGEGRNLLTAVKEAIAIGEAAGVAVQLSHHKAIGKENWGKVRESLLLIEEAQARGKDVTADQYPYIASSNGLSAVLPGWVHEGDNNDLLRRLADSTMRKRIIKEISFRDGYWESTFVSNCPYRQEYEGMSLKEIADSRGRDVYASFLDILLESGANIGIISFGMSKEDVKMVMRHPMVMVGSDGESLADYGPLSKGKPHPRNYGTFPRVLGKYSREEKVIPLEEAVRKMTSLPAGKLGLKSRGVIKEGNIADLVIFNAKTIRDRSTFKNPHQYPAGIDYVLVYGEVVIDQGRHTGKLNGKALQRENLGMN